MTEFLQIQHEEARLSGDLFLPSKPNAGICVFVHGSGSSRFSPRNQFVAGVLRSRGIGTFLLDLLTPEEEQIDNVTAKLRFNIDMLARRVVSVIDHLNKGQRTKGLPIGLFGASTGGGAALLAAHARPERVKLVISRGGRPDMVPPKILQEIHTPILLIVGRHDPQVLVLNRQAQANLASDIKELVIIEGATHLFEESGCLEKVADLAAEWMKNFLLFNGDNKG